MADRTLIVPGTQATTLRDQTGATVYNAVRVSIGLGRKSIGGRPPSLWRELLGTEHEKGGWAPARTSLLSDVRISAGEVVRAPYDRLPKPNDFFPYDWRLDLRYNAQRLIDHLRAKKPPSGRWNLIGHSQGGLIIVLASTLTRDVEEFGRLVARVVLVGCPLAGTQRALEALLVGRTDFGDPPDRVIAAREMAQTWPALYQMLPAWPSVVGPGGAPLGPEQQFTSAAGYPGAWSKGIGKELLQRARETQALLDGPFSRFGPAVRTLVIQGEKQPTPTHLVRTASDFATAGDLVGDRPALLFSDTKGDTLVPSEVTLAWGGQGLRDRTLRIAGKVKQHAMLCDGKFVTRKIREFLAAAGVGVCLLGLALSPLGVRAQQIRIQPGAGGSFSYAHLFVGLDLARDMGESDCRPGGPICDAPDWTALLALYGGVVTRSSPLRVAAHMGLERKVTDALAIGLLGVGALYPAAGGVAGRIDVQDVVALKSGYLWGEEGGCLLAVELALEFLRDLRR